MNLSKMTWGHQSHNRQVQGVPGTRSYMVNNVHESDQHTYSQWGGTPWTVSEHYTTSICDKNRDPTGLGRWCWVRLKGKRGKHVQFVSAYSPNPSLGPNTGHKQHVPYIREEKNMIDPKLIELFDWDLTAELE